MLKLMDKQNILNFTLKNINIYGEGRIEVCRVMTNSDPEGQIVLSYPHMDYGFFFLLTTGFFFK